MEASSKRSPEQGLAHNGSIGTTDPPGGDFLSPQIYNQSRHTLGNTVNTHIKTLAYEIRAPIVETAKRKKLLSQSWQDSKLKNQHNIGWGVGKKH